MLVSVEKPGSPAEVLEHVGVKGMHWGVRKQRTSTSRPKTAAELAAQHEHRKQVAKKVAIGVGVLAVVAGTAYVGYRLHKSGKLPLSSIKPKTNSKAAPEVKKIVEQTDIIHLSRGKHKGLHFLKQGGTPDHFNIWEKALGEDAHSSSKDIFKKLPDGSVASRFADPGNRSDFSGRKILHEVMVPKHMAAGIENNDDVKRKIWPLVKDAYDAMYKESEIDPRR
jgi:hypothetical protein